MLEYVYISDTKVDTIVDQIPSRLWDRIATELKIDIKVVTLTIRDQPNPQNRFARVRIAADYVMRNYEVGTVESSGTYFEGALPMRWGTYPEERLEDPIVYFGGLTEDTVLGLGGSARHVLGSSQPVAGVDRFTLAGSALPSIVDLVSRASGATDASVEDDQEVLDQTRTFTTGLRGPREQFSFLARRLLEGPSRDMTVLLGSPLYVARSSM